MASNTFNDCVTHEFKTDLESFVINSILKDDIDRNTDLEFCRTQILNKIRFKNAKSICNNSIKSIESSFDTNPQIKQNVVVK